MPGTCSGQAVLRSPWQGVSGEEKAERRDGDLGGEGGRRWEMEPILLLRSDVNAKYPHREQPVLGQGLHCFLPVLWLWVRGRTTSAGAEKWRESQALWFLFSWWESSKVAQKRQSSPRVGWRDWPVLCYWEVWLSNLRAGWGDHKVYIRQPIMW